MCEILFRGKLTGRFADAAEMRPDLARKEIIKDGFIYGSWWLVAINILFVHMSVYIVGITLVILMAQCLRLIPKPLGSSQA